MGKHQDFWNWLMKNAPENHLETATEALGNAAGSDPPSSAVGSVGRDGVHRVPPKEPAPAPPPPSGPSAREVELGNQLVTAETGRFVDRLFHDGKIVPAEREGITAAYAQAMRDDLAHPVASGQPTRAALLAAPYAARPKSLMRDEHLASDPPAGTRIVDPVDPGRTPEAGSAQAQMAKGAQGVIEWAAQHGPIKATAGNGQK